jgi:hypothetical protein
MVFVVVIRGGVELFQGECLGFRVNQIISKSGSFFNKFERVFTLVGAAPQTSFG